MSLYELIRLRSEYETVRDYLNKMINILSKSSVLDNISKAQNCLSSNYLVDDNACKYNKIGNRKEEIRSNISKLRSILRDVERRRRIRRCLYGKVKSKCK